MWIMDKNKGMMVIIIVLLLVIVGAMVAGGIFLISNMGNDDPPAIEYQPEPTPPPPLGEADIRVFTLERYIITNLLRSPGGPERIARLELGLGIDDTDPSAATDFMADLRDKEIVIRDIVTEILRRTTNEEASRIDASTLLRDDILIALQRAFGTNMIVAVYLVLYVF